MNTVGQAFSAFVILAVTIGPISTGAVFAGMVSGIRREDRARTAWRGVAIAAVILVLFGAGGEELLALLHATTPPSPLPGGLLLLLIAVDFVFGRTTGISSITSAEAQEAARE